MFSAKHQSPDRHIRIGEVGEEIACRFVGENGYRIITRNYKRNYGEIDIIGRSRDGTLVFFEVKTMQNNGKNSITPEDNLTKRKLMRISKTASMFSAKHPELIDEQKGWRVDLIAITIQNHKILDNLTEYKKHCVIIHYKNI